MATYAENFLSAIDRARARAVRISAGSYTDRDLEKLIEDVGADLELFLKSTVYGGSGRRGIAECIRGLAVFGVETADIDAFDRLRLAYNRAKHEPGTTLSFSETERLLEDAAAAVSGLQAAGPGHVNDREAIQAIRQFWLLVSDHLIGGETEIDICLPMPDVDFPPGLDMVNIEMSDWPRAQQGLAEAGEMQDGPGSIPNRVYHVWSHESDAALIGSWTGQYRDLLRALLPYEKVSGVLPGLGRGDNFPEALSAMLMAAVDLGSDGLLIGGEDDLQAEVLAHAETSYSVPASKPAALRAAQETCSVLATLTEEHRMELTGPFWRSRDDLAAFRSSAHAVGRDGCLIIAADGSVLAWSGY